MSFLAVACGMACGMACGVVWRGVCRVASRRVLSRRVASCPVVSRLVASRQFLVGAGRYAHVLPSVSLPLSLAAAFAAFFADAAPRGQRHFHQ